MDVRRGSIRGLRADFRPKRAEMKRVGRKESKPERVDFRLKRAYFRPERICSRSERADFQPERANVRPERTYFRLERPDRWVGVDRKMD